MVYSKKWYKPSSVKKNHNKSLWGREGDPELKLDKDLVFLHTLPLFNFYGFNNSVSGAL